MILSAMLVIKMEGRLGYHRGQKWDDPGQLLNQPMLESLVHARQGSVGKKTGLLKRQFPEQRNQFLALSRASSQWDQQLELLRSTTENVSHSSESNEDHQSSGWSTANTIPISL